MGGAFSANNWSIVQVWCWASEYQSLVVIERILTGGERTQRLDDESVETVETMEQQGTRLASSGPYLALNTMIL